MSLNECASGDLQENAVLRLCRRWASEGRSGSAPHRSDECESPSRLSAGARGPRLRVSLVSCSRRPVGARRARALGAPVSSVSTGAATPARRDGAPALVRRKARFARSRVRTRLHSTNVLYSKTQYRLRVQHRDVRVLYLTTDSYYRLYVWQ